MLTGICLKSSLNDFISELSYKTRAADVDPLFRFCNDLCSLLCAKRKDSGSVHSIPSKKSNQDIIVAISLYEDDPL
jgi:hypothetical protein